jgi:hypothetical protein
MSEEKTPSVPTQKPSVGRIVIYKPDLDFAGEKGKTQGWPAVITHVWSDSCVNLHVFGDGSYGSPDPTPTSVSYSESAQSYRTWSWPPRV